MNALRFLWKSPLNRVFLCLQAAFGVLLPFIPVDGAPAWGYLLVGLCVYGGIAAHLLFKEVERQKRIGEHLTILGRMIVHNAKDGLPDDTAMDHARWLIYHDGWKYPHLEFHVKKGTTQIVIEGSGHVDLAGI